MTENIWLWMKYFFFFPIFSLLPSPCPYLLARYLSFIDYRCNPLQGDFIKKQILKYLSHLEFSPKELDLIARRYFEVIFCDEIDLFIYFFRFPKNFIKRIKIEGKGNWEEALSGGKGIFLSAHFGGGFWILPFLKEKGIGTHFFSADIRKEDYPSKKALYFYHRLRNWVVERASGDKVIFKQEGKKDLIEILEKGGRVIVLFDVPPFLIKENMEVSFLGKKAVFPKGIISIAKETNSPILPFFSFLDEGKHRRICFEKPLHVIDEEECVKRCVVLIESKIIERPDHWHFWPIADQFFVNNR